MSPGFVGVPCFHGHMSFVRGHWRALGWVRSHRRTPDRPESGQLALPTAPEIVIPAQRAPAEVRVVRSARR
jgi:hypothetical protein